jgi:hypothetical protein
MKSRHNPYVSQVFKLEKVDAADNELSQQARQELFSQDVAKADVEDSEDEE